MRYLLFFFLPFMAAPAVSAPTQPHFIGDVIVKFEADGRHMTTIKDYSFVRGPNDVWTAPAGTMTDGASIPQVLWVIAAPFEDKYRNAALLHDYYCDHEVRAWRDVDRMFYDAMIASGVGKFEAGALYAGVLVGGPRWDLQTIHNERLAEQVAVLNYVKTHGGNAPKADDREDKVARLVVQGKAKVIGHAFSNDPRQHHELPDPVDVVALPLNPLGSNEQARDAADRSLHSDAPMSPEQIEVFADGIEEQNAKKQFEATGSNDTVGRSPPFVDFEPSTSDKP